MLSDFCACPRPTNLSKETAVAQRNGEQEQKTVQHKPPEEFLHLRCTRGTLGQLISHFTLVHAACFVVIWANQRDSACCLSPHQVLDLLGTRENLSLIEQVFLKERAHFRIMNAGAFRVSQAPRIRRFFGRDCFSLLWLGLQVCFPNTRNKLKHLQKMDRHGVSHEFENGLGWSTFQCS